MPYTVYLKKNEEKSLKSGYGWVFANEVAKIEGKDKNGSLATVRTFDGKFVGKGYINHLSKILVRIFIYGDADEDRVIFDRILNAKRLRESLLLGQSYRAVFAEADLLPGLVVDKFNDLLSVQILSLGMDRKKDVIVDALVRIFEPKTIVERSDAAVRLKEGLEQKKGVIYGENVTETIIDENGVKLKVDLINGQKTGYFLDQKLNRLAIRRYVKDKTVLDCFSNVGGFALNAKKAGAKQVTALDVSPLAVSQIKENAQLNGLTIDAVCCDVFEKLREYKTEGRKFDVIILDPPAFAKSSDSVTDALNGYKDVNILAMKLLTDDGILVSSSCSHFVGQTAFLNMLAKCAEQTGKAVRVLEQKMQCVDHPYLLSAKETNYLKFFILTVKDLK